MSYISATAEIMYAPFDFRFVGISDTHYAPPPMQPPLRFPARPAAEQPAAAFLRNHLPQCDPPRHDTPELPANDLVRNRHLDRVSALLLDIQQKRILVPLGRSLSQADISPHQHGLQLPPANLLRNVV